MEGRNKIEARSIPYNVYKSNALFIALNSNCYVKVCVGE